jgi:protein arginine kinase activator
MLCEKCKKKAATVLYKQTVNGVSEQMALCADCANKVSLGGLFDDNFNFFGSLFEKKPRSADEKVCTLCGSTYDQIVRDGKVGCAKCYEVFADRLRPSIERIHGNSRHVGKKPKGDIKHDEHDEKKEKLDRLRKELSEAVEQENFEQAAKLRDEIRALEG